MNIQDFNIVKEGQQKQINVAIQTVKANNFEEHVKEAFSIKGEALINEINGQRKAIYKELEDFDFEDKYDHTDDKNEGIVVEKTGDDTSKVQHSISEILSKVISDLENENTQYVMGPNMEKSKTTKGMFAAFNAHIIDCLNELINHIKDAHNEKVGELTKEEGEIDENEKYTLTEEDFKNNPDLEEQGLKPGDEITMGEALKTECEETKEPYFPKGGATSIPQGEIEAQNKEEKKS